MKTEYAIILALAPFAPILPIWAIRAIKQLPGAIKDYLVAMRTVLVK
jgi:hypothetical protein